MGRGGHRRNTYPVSFTLWLQLIRNRLSFERFSIDRLGRVGRKEGYSPASRHPRAPSGCEVRGKERGERVREGEERAREAERVRPAGGLTLSQRQLHPVFYARLFRHAFTVAQSYPLLFSTMLPLIFSPSCSNFFYDFTLPVLAPRFNLRCRSLPACLLGALRSQSIDRYSALFTILSAPL